MVKSNEMNCPRCHGALSVEKYKGIEVDRCSSCKGMWLEYHELDQLEDKEMDDDDANGMVMFRSYVGDLHCPTCQSGMQMFHYRAYELELDFCPNEHGFWLDSDEEKRVLEIMKQRVKDIKRSSNAEVEWAGMLKRFKSKSFVDNMKGMFRR
ncbi:MAG: zf-TFIIB domain-containing protein [Chloroflexi bacterium]|nr:zf-TFIIB domain-containing protein [Chloroflexota bacterium]